MNSKMDKYKLLYEEFAIDFETTFFPNDPEFEGIICRDTDIPRLNKFSDKYHTLITAESNGRPNPIRPEWSDNYKIASVNWLYFHALPMYIKACRATRRGVVDSNFLGIMPVWWFPTSSLLVPGPQPPQKESASRSGLPEAPAGKTPC